VNRFAVVDRSAKLGGVTFRCAFRCGEVEAAVPKLGAKLTNAVAAAGKVEHADMLAGGECIPREAVRKSSPRMAWHGYIWPSTPETRLAAQLVLSDGRTITYLSVG